MVKQPADYSGIIRRIAQGEPYLFYALLLCWLLPVWSVDYFVTGDGPCHLYNSKILADWWYPESRLFYQPFYYLNTSFEPNWLFNAITTPVLGVLGPIAAEKIFFTLYVLSFGLGFRYLITQINPAAKFISHIGLLLIYHRLLMTGFLNNAISLSLWFWTVGYWWSHRDDFRPGTLLRLAVLILLLYAAHPMGFTYTGITLVALLKGLWWYESRESSDATARWYRRTTYLFLCALPALLLFVEFLCRHHWTGGVSNTNNGATWEGIARLSAIQSLDQREKDWTTATAVVCMVVLISAIVRRWQARKMHPADGLLLLAAVVVYTIFNPPGSISGGLEIPLRIGIVLYPALLFWSATARFPAWLTVAVPVSAVLLTAALLSIRIPIHRQASDYAAEIRSCAPYIDDRSTLLTLNYDWTGQTPEGQPINNGTWLLTHIDGYLGIDRSLVISDNYESHFSYFPVRARGETDMYIQTDKDGINFDHRPPRADIPGYTIRSGQSIDYVLICGYHNRFDGHPHTIEIREQLQQAYEQVFVTTGGRAVLYRRKRYSHREVVL